MQKQIRIPVAAGEQRIAQEPSQEGLLSITITIYVL
jgi:hypothetical protein